MRAILLLLIFFPTVISELTNITDFFNVLNAYRQDSVDLITEEKAEQIFIEEAKRIGVPTQSHINACIESYSRLNGWKMHLETVMESLLEPFSNEGFDIDSAEEFLEYANQTSPEEFRKVYKYVEDISEALKDVNVEARIFVQSSPLKYPYQCLSDKAKRDLEKKFCYFTSYLIYDNEATRKYVEYTRSSQCPSLKMDKVEQLIDGIDISKEESAKIIREESNRIGVPAQTLADSCIDRRPLLEVWAPRLLSTLDRTISMIWRNELEGSEWDSVDKFVKLAEQADHYGYNALVLYVQALYTQTYYSKSELAELGRTVVDEYLLLAKNTSLTTPEYEINEAEIEKQLVEKISIHYNNLTDYTKNELEKTFCYFTFARISPLSDIRELIADRIRNAAYYGEL
ncbi:hypothetical protein PRIPAC_88956 [Pristionchus pacificus]|uniref:Fatty-acid and retinol-binding protein 1 n=1 Tax=Pristionchus pacificus TaxID=54126 RepID=A0A2A6B5L3_PRIPA|nr:hypothetical protein PRIPAC_88956 [Pristionchus pacificus]|eukprot:PDM61162.1 hypothetical protein PRIPAC_50604 [Pristionchus pacificus]